MCSRLISSCIAVLLQSEVFIVLSWHKMEFVTKPISDASLCKFKLTFTPEWDKTVSFKSWLKCSVGKRVNWEVFDQHRVLWNHSLIPYWECSGSNLSSVLKLFPIANYCIYSKLVQNFCDDTAREWGKRNRYTTVKCQDVWRLRPYKMVYLLISLSTFFSFLA